MPGTTSKGLPYPLGTDRVADGDNAIHDLAKGIEAFVQAGTVIVNVTAADTVCTTAVTFPVAYASPPNVVAGVGGSITATGSGFVWPTAVTSSGFTMNAKRTPQSASFPCNWQAVGPIGPVSGMTQPAETE